MESVDTGTRHGTPGKTFPVSPGADQCPGSSLRSIRAVPKGMIIPRISAEDAVRVASTTGAIVAGHAREKRVNLNSSRDRWKSQLQSYTLEDSDSRLVRGAWSPCRYRWGRKRDVPPPIP